MLSRSRLPPSPPPPSSPHKKTYPLPPPPSPFFLGPSSHWATGPLHLPLDLLEVPSLLFERLACHPASLAVILRYCQCSSGSSSSSSSSEGRSSVTSSVTTDSIISIISSSSSDRSSSAGEELAPAAQGVGHLGPGGPSSPLLQREAAELGRQQAVLSLATWFSGYCHNAADLLDQVRFCVVKGGRKRRGGGREGGEYAP